MCAPPTAAGASPIAPEASAAPKAARRAATLPREDTSQPGAVCEDKGRCERKSSYAMKREHDTKWRMGGALARVGAQHAVVRLRRKKKAVCWRRSACSVLRA